MDKYQFGTNEFAENKYAGNISKNTKIYYGC